MSVSPWLPADHFSLFAPGAWDIDAFQNLLHFVNTQIQKERNANTWEIHPCTPGTDAVEDRSINYEPHEYHAPNAYLPSTQTQDQAMRGMLVDQRLENFRSDQGRVTSRSRQPGIFVKAEL